MNFFERARIRYILHRHAVPHRLWLETTERLSLLRGMTAVEKAHLREISTLLLHEKNFIGAQGFRVTAFMRMSIAVQACLPILGLGLNCLNDWKDIIVYPGLFRVNRDIEDAIGVVHRDTRVLSGESWSAGPIVLSWADVKLEMREFRAGRNLVIHEIAHKLDALNGITNGYPPLHPGMSVSEWTQVFSKAYESLVQGSEYGFIDPYAADSPAEFFAVVSEYFFCSPGLLYTRFPNVYQELQLYYRQDPLQRIQDRPSPDLR